MKCPYCLSEVGNLPIGAVRASMRGHRMLQIFDLIVESGDRGVSLINIVTKLYPDRKTDAFNTVKVTMIRLKERMRRFGWDIESGVAIDSSVERVYRIKRVTYENA
jgi:hypothetical protein